MTVTVKGSGNLSLSDKPVTYHTFAELKAAYSSGELHKSYHMVSNGYTLGVYAPPNLEDRKSERPADDLWTKGFDKILVFECDSDLLLEDLLTAQGIPIQEY